MKKFSKAEIEGGRAYLQSKNCEEVRVDLDNRVFSYFVLPQSMEPSLPHFVFRMTGDPGDGYVFGVSDSVPEAMRAYPVVHEFIEFTEIGIDTPRRCAKALDAELALVPGTIKQDYVQMRADFFRALIPYCERRPENYTVNDLDEFRHSLRRLEEIIGK